MNPIRCRAHGMCAEILPERVVLDDWGYAMVDGAPLPGELEALARRAVDICPVFALGLEQATPTPRRPAGAAPTRR